MKKIIIALLILVVGIPLLVASYGCGCGNDKSQAQKLMKEAYEILDQGNFDEVIVKCDQAIEIDPENADAYAMRGFMY